MEGGGGGGVSRKFIKLAKSVLSIIFADFLAGHAELSIATKKKCQQRRNILGQMCPSLN